MQTLAAFAEELRRVIQENNELRQGLARMAALYEKAANDRDASFAHAIEAKLKEKNT